MQSTKARRFSSAVLDDLRTLGIAFASYQENLTCTTATGQLIFQLLGAFAEFERSLIRERVKAGLANAQAKGKGLGWPRKLVDHETVRALREDRVRLRQIARMNGWDVEGLALPSRGAASSAPTADFQGDDSPLDAAQDRQGVPLLAKTPSFMCLL